MVAELEAVENNMNNFAATILNQGIDVHVVVIAKPGEPDGGSIFNPDPGLCIGAPQGGWFYDNNASPTTVKVCLRRPAPR